MILNQSERSEPVSSLEKCISEVRSWSISHKAMFNNSKTEVIHVSSKYKQSPSFPKISIGESAIEINFSVKSLSVIIDDTLQIITIVSKACLVHAASFVTYRIGQN